jgi:hypothetical protein
MLKNLFSGTLVTVGLLTSICAKADEPPAPPASEAAPASVTVPAAEGAVAAKMRVGFNIVPMPIGTLKASALGMTFSSDAAFAFGVLPFFDYMVSPNFFVGFGPTFVFNVKGKDGGTAAKELDLSVRLGGGAPISDTMQLYGYLSPGYSIIMPSMGDSAKGFALGVHAGAMYSISPTAFLNGELGYQVGFQKISVGGMSADFKVSYVQIALGGGLRF